MHIFKVVKIDKMGEPDEKFGTSFWAEVAEQLEPVMFASHKDFEAGDTLLAEEKVAKTSKKGTSYFLLKKVSKAQNVDETLVEAPQNASEGTTLTVATPQTLKFRFEPTLDEILKAVNDLQLEFQELKSRLLGEEPDDDTFEEL